MKITIELPFVRKEKVLVENYRSSYKPYEEGTISSIKVEVEEDGSFNISYDVFLDRRRADGRVLWLYVDGTKLRKIKLQYEN